MSDEKRTELKIIYIFGYHSNATLRQELVAEGYVDDGNNVTLKGRTYLGETNNGVCIVPQCNERIAFTLACSNHHYFHYRRGLRGEDLIQAQTKPSKKILQLIEYIMRECNEKGLDYDDPMYNAELIHIGITQGYLELVGHNKSAVTFTSRAFSLRGLDDRPKIKPEK